MENEVDVYLNLYESYINKTKAVAKKNAMDMYGDEEEPNLLYEKLTGKFEEVIVDIDKNTITFAIETPVGYIRFEWQPDIEELTQIVTIAVKKMNKLKTAFEAMKNY